MSQGLKNSNLPSLLDLAAALPSNFGTDPIVLLSFTDFALRNRYDNEYEGSQAWNTFITGWGNGLAWDLKTSFAWNLND